jgi:hypothetical protein
MLLLTRDQLSRSGGEAAQRLQDTPREQHAGMHAHAHAHAHPPPIIITHTAAVHSRLRLQDIDGAVPKIRNGTFHFPSGRRTNPLTPDYPPLEKPMVSAARVMCNMACCGLRPACCPGVLACDGVSGCHYPVAEAQGCRRRRLHPAAAAGVD